MSSTPANINIDISDKCDLKCRLILGYPNEGVNISSKEDSNFLEISSTKLIFQPGNANITYNTATVSLNTIHIVKPSLHTYASKRIDAELILSHGDGNTLLCIPIISTSFTGILDDTLERLENSEASYLNMDNIVPKKPFYAYTGGINGGSGMNIIVFEKRDALTISKKRLELLTSHDRKHKFEVDNDEKISYNKNGPENQKLDKSFPITCEPILGVEYVKMEKRKKSPFTMSETDLNEWGNKAIVQIILGMLTIILLYRVFGYIFIRTKKIANNVSDSVGG